MDRPGSKSKRPNPNFHVETAHENGEDRIAISFCRDTIEESG